MFGKNPQLPPDQGDGKTLAVQEIFYTLQGEGPFAGMPAVFVRLAGCGLACTFCDTAFDRVDNRMTIEVIREEVAASWRAPQSAWQPLLMVISGGEPLRQDITGLVDAMCKSGWSVQIETAGYMDPVPRSEPSALHLTDWLADGPKQGSVIDPYLPRLHIVCSPKTAKVGRWVRRYCRHWKYVVRSGDVHPGDGLPVRATQAQGMPGTVANPAIFRGGEGTTWLSPCDEYDVAKNAANMRAAVSSCLEFGHRLNLQAHKIANVP